MTGYRFRRFDDSPVRSNPGGDVQPRIGWRPYSRDPAVPSARLRSFLPYRYLTQVGWNIEMLDDTSRGHYDCAVFQKAYTDEDLALAQRLAAEGAKIVFDLCDNHFYNPGASHRLAQRAERVQRLVDLADVVTVSTPQVGHLVGARPTFLIDDAFDVPSTGKLEWARIRVRAVGRGTRLRLVWFGSSGAESPAFGMVHLSHLMPVLERLSLSLPLELTVISDSQEQFTRYVQPASIPTRYLTWRRRNFASHFLEHDVCIVPVEKNPYTICKTNNRLVAALTLGLPVVAGLIPSYEEFAPWVSFEDWERHISAYARDEDLRRAHVEGARRHIRETYTEQRLVAQWERVFRTLLP